MEVVTERGGVHTVAHGASACSSFFLSVGNKKEKRQDATSRGTSWPMGGGPANFYVSSEKA